MSKHKSVLVIDLADKVLAYPSQNQKPVRFVVLYCRDYCRDMNAWIGRWERAGGAFPLLGMDDLPRKNSHGEGPTYSRTPSPWESVLLESGTKPLLHGVDGPCIRRVMNKMMMMGGGGGGGENGSEIPWAWG